MIQMQMWTRPGNHLTVFTKYQDFKESHDEMDLTLQVRFMMVLLIILDELSKSSALCIDFFLKFAHVYYLGLRVFWPAYFGISSAIPTTDISFCILTEDFILFLSLLPFPAVKIQVMQETNSYARLLSIFPLKDKYSGEVYIQHLIFDK